jgi:hypothetical protein
VLCYAPYNRWALHGLWEMTILRALKLRGAEVEYVLCDGLYTDCDQFWGAIEPRPANACVACQASVINLVSQMGMDFVWLGRYLTTDEGREAKRWADSLAPEELLRATYGSWEVGEWIRSSVQSHFRSNEIDVRRPAMEKVVRSYLYSGLIACFGLDRLLVESAPDVLLLFNGRQSSTRVALELARRRQVRVVTHERGLRYETLALVENEPCYSLKPYRRYWREWGDVPLTEAEVYDAARLMAEREHGRGLAWSPLSAPPQPVDEVRAQLGLSAERPTWVLFTSSDDETAGDEDYASPFASQREWIERTIEHARRNPQLDLVIRVHPNTGSRRSTGANRVQLEEMKRLAEALPPNVRMIEPDEDISSYSLMEICAVGLVWISTVGLELACKGKNVVVAAGNYVAGTSFVHTVEDPADYEQMLDSLTGLAPGAASAEIKRLALRLAYGMFFRIPIDFPLVAMPNHKTGRLTYNSTDALLPGRDPGLDRCVRVLLEGEPVCPAPNPPDLARTIEAEDAFLKAVGKPRLTVLAYAEELIADDGLLVAWGETFGADDEVTLLIHTLAQDTPLLIEAVSRAGLDGEDGPDLVAGELDDETMASVSAVFSRSEASGAPAGAPRYDTASLTELAKVA